MTNKEIIQKLTVELEFVASTFGARSRSSPRKYAERRRDASRLHQDEPTDRQTTKEISHDNQNGRPRPRHA